MLSGIVLHMVWSHLVLYGSYYIDVSGRGLGSVTLPHTVLYCFVLAGPMWSRIVLYGVLSYLVSHWSYYIDASGADMGRGPAPILYCAAEIL